MGGDEAMEVKNIDDVRWALAQIVLPKFLSPEASKKTGRAFYTRFIEKELNWKKIQQTVKERME